MIKLEKCNGYSEEYRCRLTMELDEISGISKSQHYNMFYHYILADNLCRKERCLPIRVPGGTVGGIWIDDNDLIIKIVIDKDYVIDTYPDDVNEIIQKYIGEVIKW